MHASLIQMEKAQQKNTHTLSTPPNKRLNTTTETTNLPMGRPCDAIGGKIVCKTAEIDF